MGCTDRPLGLLAQSLGRDDEAEAHLTSAIAIERRMNAVPFFALYRAHS
jgi:hypothetical protein